MQEIEPRTMTEQITLTIPEEISDRARQIAAVTAQSVEAVLLEHLKTLSTPLPVLPPEQQAELDALHQLSDDTLWTIAREQMPEAAQSRADALMGKPASALTDDEQTELDQLVERADCLMLRRAEASAILRSRSKR
jgi:hypothetical protein